MKPNHHIVLRHFVAACQANVDIVAAFLAGSYATGQADGYSDLDLCVITTDEAFDAFIADRETFILQLGRPVFLENFSRRDRVFFILSDETEGELNFGREHDLDCIHSGPFQILVDKKGILKDVSFPPEEVDRSAQRESLRKILWGFWHELSHFITAVGRGQSWWAYGQLEALRGQCVSLARLKHDFEEDLDRAEPYFKVDQTLPNEALLPLMVTCVSREPHGMIAAARGIVRFYLDLALPLAQVHRLTYPAELEYMMTERLKNLEQPS